MTQVPLRQRYLLRSVASRFERWRGTKAAPEEPIRVSFFLLLRHPDPSSTNSEDYCQPLHSCFLHKFDTSGKSRTGSTNAPTPPRLSHRHKRISILAFLRFTCHLLRLTVEPISVTHKGVGHSTRPSYTAENYATECDCPLLLVQRQTQTYRYST